MKPLRTQARILIPALFLALGGLGSECGKDVGSGSAIRQAQTACQPKQAQIMVYDGFLQSLCGCVGTEGKIVPMGTGQRLNCTMPVGTVAFFMYSSSNQRQHQIMGMGTPNIGTSAVSDPQATIFVPAFVVQPPSVGTYEFRETYDGIDGSFIVN